MQLTKQQIIKLLLGAYIAFSLVFILYSLWNNFKINYGQQAYNQGKVDTVNQLFSQAEDPACKPFSVFNEQKQVQLISVSCLQTSEGAATDQPAETK